MFTRALTAYFLVCACAATLSANAPALLFTDLESGPNRGGEGDAGAFVTLHGTGFGSSRGTSTVTIGGAQVARYMKWSTTEITVQLGPGVLSGQMVVNTSAGRSNGLPFVVRSGVIYFVTTSGNDSATGLYSSPWRTIARARKAVRPGDIVYIGNGVQQTTLDEHDAALAIETAGLPGQPIALVAYPGASVYVGDSSPTDSSDAFSHGIRTPNIAGGPFGYWVISGLRIVAKSALSLSSTRNWRLIGNTFECPRGNGQTGCVVISQSHSIELLGNTVQNAGVSGASKLYHSIYLTTDTDNTEVGWNNIFNNKACRGIQVHSSPLSPFTITGVNLSSTPATLKVNTTTVMNGIKVYISGLTGVPGLNGGTYYARFMGAGTIALYRDADLRTPVTASGSLSSGATVRFGQNQHGIDIHDNYIADQPCDAINLATVDPSEGAVRVYNNLLVNNGKGPVPPDGNASYTGIYMPGTTNVGSAGTGTIEVFNNTLYSCGAMGSNPSAGAIMRTSASPGLKVSLRNNIVVSLTGQQYFPYSNAESLMSGSNNIWYGDGPGPSQTTGNKNVDPGFVNPGGRDFRLKAGSPAINAGVSTSALRDYDGTPRPTGNYFDIGAFEYEQTTTSTPPPPPPPPPPTTSFQPIRINAGATASHTGTQGTWLSDRFYEGGTLNRASEEVTGAAVDPGIYMTYHYGAVTYRVTVPNGTRTVRLKFSEPFGVTTGYRRFHVLINGVRVLTNFDIVAAAGAAHEAIDRTFTTTVSTGTLTIELQAVTHNPVINGIEIL